MSIVPHSVQSDAGAGPKGGPIREDPGASTDDPALPDPMGAGEGKPGPQLPAPGPRFAEGYGGRFVPIAPAGGSRGAGRFDTNRLADVDLNALGLGEALRSRSAARPGAPLVRAPVPGPGPEAAEDDVPVLAGATPSSGTGHRALDIVMTPGAAVPPAIRAAVGAAGGSRAGQGPATSAGPSGADASGDVPAMLRGMREADRSPRPSGSMGVAQAGGSDAAATPHVADQPAAAPPHGENTDVMLLDDHGNQVKSQGRNVVRPASFDPKMFVRQGLADRVLYDALGFTYGGAASQQMFLMVKLSQFRHYGSWDIQQVGGKFNPLYVDYSTIAIGLYSAAFGLSEDETLSIENQYARFFHSTFAGAPMDKKYTHLAERNVINTNIGYQLYNSKNITGF